MVNSWDIADTLNFDSSGPVVIAARLKRKPDIYELPETYVDSLILPRLLRNIIIIHVDRIFVRLAKCRDSGRFSNLIAALRCKPVTCVNSSNIFPFFALEAPKYRLRSACAYSNMLRRVTFTSFGNTNFDATTPLSITFINF